MISEGQIVLLKFPQTDQEEGKLRPALVLRMLPGKYDDWLICMISSQLHRYVPDIDERITSDGPDFQKSGLKLPNIIRVSRLAVVEANIFLGRLGKIENARLIGLKNNLCKWIQSAKQGKCTRTVKSVVRSSLCFLPPVICGVMFFKKRVSVYGKS